MYELISNRDGDMGALKLGDLMGFAMSALVIHGDYDDCERTM